MYRTQCVLALLALYVGLAHSFSWDIVVARAKLLEFYYDGTLTYSVPTSQYNNWITYDPLHNRVLFAKKISLSDPASFDIASGKTQSLITKKPDQYARRLAYDPATELLFVIIDKIMYSFSLKPGSDSEAKGNLVINLQKDPYPREVVVDSCGGYIYWTTYNKSNIIERARFNGSKREVIMDRSVGNIDSIMVRQGLTIDPQTQKIYWIEYEDYNDDEFSIESADLNGNNARTVYREIRESSVPTELAVSKDFIYWGDSYYTFFWKLPKHPPRGTDVKPKQISMDITSSWGIRGIATNYNIDEQTQGVQNCKALKRLLPNYSETNDCASLNVSTDESLLCVHGTKVSGESRCECTQGYSGERCDVSVCHNYCFQGVCSTSSEGQPKCRCNAGYSGERCEVNACHEYCLNSGVCSLSEKSAPVCQCTGHYEGERCDVPVFLVKCFQTVSMLKDILNSDVTLATLGKRVKSTCASTLV